MTLTLTIFIIAAPLCIGRQLKSVNTILNLFFLGLLNEKIILYIRVNKMTTLKTI